LRGKQASPAGTVIGPTEGTIVNQELVKQDWCWWYRKYAPNNSSNPTYVVLRLRCIQTASRLDVLCVLPAHL